jgi:hypothetical protein
MIDGVVGYGEGDMGVDVVDTQALELRLEYVDLGLASHGCGISRHGLARPDRSSALQDFLHFLSLLHLLYHLNPLGQCQQVPSSVQCPVGCPLIGVGLSR